jgi:hypothetical protein
MVDLDHALFLVDGVEDAVPASSQTSQVWGPVSKRFRRARLPASWLMLSQSAATPAGSSRRKPVAWSRARISQLTW